jgi:hypothetical protein
MSSESFENISKVNFNFDSIKNDCDFIYTQETRTENAYRLRFLFSENVEVNIRILFHDESGSDIVITNMTTLESEGTNDVTHKGYGSKVISSIIDWAREQNMHEIRATQVSNHVEEFWIKNGFNKIPEPNPTNDYLYNV